MLSHGFVPQQFRYGFMIPIVKDTQGDHGDVGNYRGVTISPTLSKVFEHVLKILFSDHLATSTYQFGFNKKRSTVDALFCLKQTINYYIENGSQVFCSFLDASKAFDRLVHSGLFIKLIDRKVPKVFLDIVITWHNGLFCRVKWDDTFSAWFPINAVVRQGGVLSPDFYSIYVDELLAILQRAGIGCYVLGTFAAALFYADDMAVLAPSVKGLQKLLDICLKWDILLNSKKTKNLFFGKGSAPSFHTSLNGTIIPWETQWEYLGVTLKSGTKFDCCNKKPLASFYRSMNSITPIVGKSNDLVMLRLLESHCLPILTYGIEVIDILDRDDRRQSRVAYNAIFRKIYSYSYFESVTRLQQVLGHCTWEELTEKRFNNFKRRCGQYPSSSLVRLLCNLLC